MDLSYIILAVPVFFLLIGLELVIARIQENDYYRFSDSINDLSCGIIQQILEVFLKTALFAGYLFLYERHRLVSIPSASAAAWVACFLGVEFFYYWFHRAGHRINAVWATHVVHHQSEEFNLAVALRQGAFQNSFSWVFYLPLAVLGFPPLMFLTVSSFNTLYQFWIHTRAIGKLGPLEWVLNTPSHHRVHHARNPKYIDCNLGGTLIVWDRLFGTFKEEEEEPVYGITQPLTSWNPVWANVHYWVELGRKARRTKRLTDRIRLFLKPPGWHPEELGGYVGAPEVERATYRKFDLPVPSGLKAYVFVQFLAVLGLATAFLFRQQGWDPPERVAAAIFVVLSLAVLGGLLEARAWAFAAEIARLVAGAGVLAYLAAASGLWAATLAAAVAAAGLLAWLLRFRRRLIAAGGVQTAAG